MKTKKTHLEILRILAILMIMYVHTGGRGYTLILDPKESNYFVDLTLSTIAKIGVPIFYLISGALLLKKSENYNLLFRKRIFKYIFIIIVVNLVYYFRDILLIDKRPFDLHEIIFEIYHSSKYPPGIWYLYSYLSFLVMLPLLRKLVQNMENKDFYYFFGLVFILKCLIPIIATSYYKFNAILNPSFSSYLFTSEVIVFPFLGYFLEVRVLDINKKQFVIAIIAFLTSIVLNVYFVKYYCQQIIFSNSITDYETMFGVINIVSVPSLYVIVRYLFNSVNCSSSLLFFSSSVFGIYLIEPLLTYETSFIFNYLYKYLPINISVIIWLIISLIIGAVIVNFFMLMIKIIKNLFISK